MNSSKSVIRVSLSHRKIFIRKKNSNESIGNIGKFSHLFQIILNGKLNNFLLFSFRQTKKKERKEKTGEEEEEARAEVDEKPRAYFIPYHHHMGVRDGTDFMRYCIYFYTIYYFVEIVCMQNSLLNSMDLQQ